MNRPFYEIVVLLLLVSGIGLIMLQQLGSTFCPS